MWKVIVHRLVLEEDFKKIDSSQQARITKIIKKKLTQDPHAYGKPLSGEFAGYWRLRVEGYRVIYKIVKNKILVLVLKVGIRRDAQVYEELFSRLKKLGEK